MKRLNKILSMIYATRLSSMRRMHDNEDDAKFYSINSLSLDWGNCWAIVLFIVLWLFKAPWIGVSWFIAVGVIPPICHSIVFERTEGLYDKVAGDYQATRTDRNLLRVGSWLLIVLVVVALLVYITQAIKLYPK